MSKAGRFDYLVFDQKAESDLGRIKTLFLRLEDEIKKITRGRETGRRAADNALASAEESYMWCGKLIRDLQSERTGKAVDHPQRTDC